MKFDMGKKKMKWFSAYALWHQTTKTILQRLCRQPPGCCMMCQQQQEWRGAINWQIIHYVEEKHMSKQLIQSIAIQNGIHWHRLQLVQIIEEGARGLSWGRIEGHLTWVDRCPVAIAVFMVLSAVPTFVAHSVHLALFTGYRQMGPLLRFFFFFSANKINKYTSQLVYQ